MNFELTSACNSAKELIKDESYFANLNEKMTYEEFLEWTTTSNLKSNEIDIEDVEAFMCPNSII